MILLEHTLLLACFVFVVRPKLLLFRRINFRKHYFCISISISELRLGTTFWVSGFRFLAWDVGCGVWSLGFGVWGLGFRVLDFGFRVPGLGSRVLGLGFRVSGFGFRVVGFRVSGFGGFGVWGDLGTEANGHAEVPHLL